MRADRLGTVLLGLLLVPPAALLVASLYGVHGMWFWDARTMPCGLAALLADGNPNAYLNRPDYAGACAGYAYEFMLPPAVSHLLALLYRSLGNGLSTALYGLAYAAAVLALLWPRAGRAIAPGAQLALAALTACGVYLFELGSGNLTMPFLGALFVLCGGTGRSPRLGAATLLCGVAALFKPLFALYLIVPLFAGGSVLAAAAALAAATLTYAADAALNAAEFDRWSALVVGVVYRETHFGLLRLLAWLAPGEADWRLELSVFAAFGALLLALLWRTRHRFSRPADAAMAALVAATLLQPRLKEYDTVILIPVCFWLDAMLSPAHRRLMRRLLLAVALVAPALWWWGRKLRLVLGVDHPTLTQWADPGWMIAHQGFFVAAAAAILFAFLLALPARADVHPT